jgi:hypothetical protein
MRRRKTIVLFIVAAVGLALVCLIVFQFSRHRAGPDAGKAVAGRFRPKITRPLRKNAPRSALAQKMKADAGGGPPAAGQKFYCNVKVTNDEAAGTRWLQIDTKCTGAYDRCEMQWLNAYGELVRSIVYESCGSVASECREIKRNEYGEIVADNVDSKCRGRFDDCRTHERNDHGDVVEEVDDKGCKGVLEADDDQHDCISYVYNEDGTVASDAGGTCGAEPDFCTDYDYDLAAGVQREKITRGCQGAPEACFTRIYPGVISDDASHDAHLFIDKGCTGNWSVCVIRGDDGYSFEHFRGNEICAAKFAEITQRNQESRQNQQ